MGCLVNWVLGKQRRGSQDNGETRVWPALGLHYFPEASHAPYLNVLLLHSGWKSCLDFNFLLSRSWLKRTHCQRISTSCKQARRILALGKQAQRISVLCKHVWSRNPLAVPMGAYMILRHLVVSNKCKQVTNTQVAIAWLVCVCGALSLCMRRL